MDPVRVEETQERLGVLHASVENCRTELIALRAQILVVELRIRNIGLAINQEMNRLIHSTARDARPPGS